MKKTVKNRILKKVGVSKKTKIIKKTSILKKISKAIILNSFVSALIIGIVGVIGITVMSKSVGQMFEKSAQPLRYLNQVQSSFASLRLDLSEMVYEDADNSAECQKMYDNITSNLKLYSKSITSKEEKTNLNFITDNIGQYKTVMESVLENVQKGDKKAALDSFSSAGGGAAVQLQGEINRALSLNAKFAQQRQAMTYTVYYVVLAIFLLLIVLFLHISKAKGKNVSKRISGPINKMIAAANSVSQGDFDVDLDIKTGDETEELSNSLRKIIDTFRRMETDLDLQINNVMKGEFDELADSSKHEGEFRKIVDAVNKMLEAIQKPFAVFSKFVDNLANGVRQDYIDESFNGNFAMLVNNLNNVKSSLTILLEESQKLEKAGINGELDVRGDESRLKGYYAEIIHGVNSNFDAIKEPLDTASEFISNLADGIHQDDIDNTYNGYYASLIDNLNSVHHSIGILLREEQKVVQAGQNGQLDIRCDESGVKGLYAEIISGINGFIDAVSKPLTESDEILKKMAVDDFTAKMSEDYSGMYKNLAVSINKVIDCLLSVEEVFGKLAQGDISMLEEYEKIGKRSENDKLIPSSIMLGRSLKDLIDASEKQYNAAVAGNLDEHIDESNFAGGYRKIVHGINETIDAFAAPIRESCKVLSEFEKGDLTTEITGEYNGDYNLIKEAVNGTIKEYNKLLLAIRESANQVAAGSKQISDSSQLVSQGATEQASSVEELDSTISDIAEQTKQNALNAQMASETAIQEQNNAASGNEKMKELLDSMNSINESSRNISKIIKTIDDIAFQTNILALNAAVEAARAGQYGKGFAVVAEEVRNLAQKSAQASKDTTVLIEDSIQRAEAGTKIAEESAEVLNKIVNGIKRSSELLGKIASASNEQATAISQIDTGITQISSIVQTNSATAEESAASSEELSEQANVLFNMVKQFKLKNHHQGNLSN